MAKLKNVITTGVLSTGFALFFDLPSIYTAAVVGGSVLVPLVLPHVVNAANNFGSWVKSKKTEAKQMLQTGYAHGAEIAHAINPLNDNQNAWLIGSTAFTTTVAVAKNTDPRVLAGITATGFVVGAALDTKRVGRFFSDLGQKLTTAPSKQAKPLSSTPATVSDIAAAVTKEGKTLKQRLGFSNS
jgi:hypothetical protein